MAFIHIDIHSSSSLTLFMVGDKVSNCTVFEKIISYHWVGVGFIKR